MTFNQFDINLSRFRYIIEESGVRVINKRLFSTAERFVPFEDIGSEIIKEKEQRLIWLVISILFLILSIGVFINRLTGGNVGDGSEIFWLSLSAVFFIIYSFRKKNSLFLFKDDMENGIEFIGTKLYEKRLNQFVKQLLQRRDDYLLNKYSVLNGLTLDETIICANAAILPEDGLFLKKLTKRPIEKLKFESEYSDVGKPAGICSVTTEKKARDIIVRHRDRFISEGKYIFISEFSDKEYYIGLSGKTSDPYKIMEYAGTNGINYNRETKDIIAKYKQWEMQFGVTPIGIGSDFCECEIINKDIDYKKLAAEVYEFCPDVVEQGTETVELLEKEIKKTGRIFLWWD